MVKGELEYPSHHDHESDNDVHGVLLPPPGGELDAVVAIVRVYDRGLAE